MKTLKRLSLASVACSMAVTCGYALSIGDNAELFLTGTLGVRRDSNIFLRSTAISDTIIDADPGFEVAFGQGSATTGKFAFTESFTAYSSHSELNSSLPKASFNSSFEDGKTKLGFDASYSELNQNTVDSILITGAPPTLVRRDVSAIDGNGEIAATEKTSVSGAIEYENTNYKAAGYSDQTALAVPLNFYYELTPKVDAGLGYRYRTTTQQIGFDSHDHFFSFAARGEFTPKLNGALNVGWERRNFSGRSSASLLGVDANLTYAATPKVTAQVGLVNDFGASAVGEQEKNLEFRSSVSAAVSEQWKFTAGLAYRWIDYYTRTDDYFEGQLGLTFVVNAHVNITGGLAYRKNDSGRDQSETTDAGSHIRSFDDSVISLASTFRF